MIIILICNACTVYRQHVIDTACMLYQQTDSITSIYETTDSGLSMHQVYTAAVCKRESVKKSRDQWPVVSSSQSTALTVLMRTRKLTVSRHGPSVAREDTRGRAQRLTAISTRHVGRYQTPAACSYSRGQSRIISEKTVISSAKVSREPRQTANSARGRPECACIFCRPISWDRRAEGVLSAERIPGSPTAPHWSNRYDLSTRTHAETLLARQV